MAVATDDKTIKETVNTLVGTCHACRRATVYAIDTSTASVTYRTTTVATVSFPVSNRTATGDYVVFEVDIKSNAIRARYYTRELCLTGAAAKIVSDVDGVEFMMKLYTEMDARVSMLLRAVHPHPETAKFGALARWTSESLGVYVLCRCRVRNALVGKSALLLDTSSITLAEDLKTDRIHARVDVTGTSMQCVLSVATDDSATSIVAFGLEQTANTKQVTSARAGLDLLFAVLDLALTKLAV